MDIFDRIAKDSGGPLGQYRQRAFGYYMYPKLEGELGPHMIFNGKEVLCWSLNNYLGLANHPEVRKVDAEAAAREIRERACRLREEGGRVPLQLRISGHNFHD